MKLQTIRPYGDTTDDGAIQLSFTLPLEPGALAREAAEKMVLDWGFQEAKVAHMSLAGDQFSFFVVFAKATQGVDLSQVTVHELTTELRDYKEIDLLIKKNIKRPIRVVGANTGFDAHTVGLDAILNMKGFDGDVGLERYQFFEVINMGSQVPVQELVETAVEFKADAILLSKIVTQKDIHVSDMKEVAHFLKKTNQEDQFILIVGGPRITHKMALELGYDAGFTIGAKPSDVANYLYETVLKKIKETS